MARPFLELRLHRAKPPQEFVCNLLHQEEKYVVLRYTSSGSYTIGTSTIEKGTITIAHYWKNRNHILWKFKKPDDTLIGYLFHIAQHLEIGEDYVRYVDLELDIWFSPDGSPTVLDQDEVNDYYKRGIFDEKTFSLTKHQKMDIMHNFNTIIRDIWSEEAQS